MSSTRRSSHSSTSSEKSPPSSPTTLKSPISPSASSASQPFIYPIRSAVSVKPPTDRHGSETSKHSGSFEGIHSPSSNPSNLPSTSTDSHRRPAHFRTNTRSSLGFDSSGDSSFQTAHSASKASSEIASGAASDSTHRALLNGEDTPATGVLDPAEREQLEAMTQTRFKHVETDEGHMILTGRDGELLRCEDEVRFPGSARSLNATAYTPTILLAAGPNSANSHSWCSPIFWLHGRRQRGARRIATRSPSFRGEHDSTLSGPLVKRR